MTARFERMLTAFHAARSQADPSERERILAAASGDDAAMLAELRTLLADEVPEQFLAVRGPTARRRLDEFELRRPIGQGGSGVVWRAHQPSLRRDVAIKLLAGGGFATRTQIERFRRETLAASRLVHPRIVPILRQGQTEGMHWFAMPFVDGHSLAHELALQRERRAAPRRRARRLLPTFGSAAWYDAVARLVADAADALHFAHRHQIVHLDIKPQNLLLDRNGAVMVADFGSARDDRSGVAEREAVAGSWHYMSPEQTRAARGGLDHRTDVYSLGVVLYELLTLALPFAGETPAQIVDAICRQTPPPVRAVSPTAPTDLAAACAVAMARAPDDRHPDAAALRDELLRFAPAGRQAPPP